MGGDVPGAERGHDQALHMFSERVDEHAVVASAIVTRSTRPSGGEPG